MRIISDIDGITGLGRSGGWGTVIGRSSIESFDGGGVVTLVEAESTVIVDEDTFLVKVDLRE